ncbi:adenosylmethionine--8-amino-7-oxononanoate transaminase [Schlesneria paludicola]|uniref:adenosylmethionine--8-amino-7-oxononanoate transaminase n=1 Tax=Schlesneria paludicola TaxID=360056 RepID=UPI00029AD01F|nr:adenosylmethionine--8-amino-7-oxononanoate transaminase [Schlesneria paludicola]
MNERPAVTPGTTPQLSNSLRELDNAHVWHPFTAMSAYRREQAPIIVDAEGFHLVDEERIRYLDGHSSLWCNIHGHRVPAIDAAITNQLQRVAHTTLLGLSNAPSIELAAELVRRAPSRLNKVFYADCGAAGVEVALKIAYQYYRQRATPEDSRDKFIYFDGAYHGDTIGTMSIGSISRFKNLYSPLLFPAVWAKVPAASPDHPLRESEQLEFCTHELERLLIEHQGRIAGVVIEPLVQAAAGINVQATGFLERVRQLTRRFDTLMIADEIAVGFGRTGTLFACEQENVSPDILILSKGLTGGYLPLAATMITDEIDTAFLGEPWEGRTFFHGHTYTGNPLACAAALASIRLIDDNAVLENVQRVTAVLKQELAPLKQHPQVKEVRQQGAMVGIELHNAGTPFPPERRVGHEVTLACRRRGVILRNIADVIVLMPAPAMPEQLVLELCQVVRDSIQDGLN